jgi:hypothetical protein
MVAVEAFCIGAFRQPIIFHDIKSGLLAQEEVSVACDWA